MQASNTLPARPAQFDPSKQRRNSMLGKLAIGWKQINMAEADYRQAMLERTGRISAAECTDAQLVVMLDFLKSKGFRPLPRKGLAQHPMAKKARALWISLYQLGVVHNSSEQALEAFAKRQLKCERMVWARQSDAYKLIEALKGMADRAGWTQHNRVTQKHLTPRQLQASLCELILVRLKDAKVAPANWSLEDAQFKLCGIEQAEAWTAEDFARLAAALGEKLRQHGGPQVTKGNDNG